MKRLLIFFLNCLYLPVLTAYGIPELTYTTIHGIKTKLTQASISDHFVLPEQDTPQNCKLILGILTTHMPTTKAALAAGADRHVVLKGGWTPLHLAARAGFVFGFLECYEQSPFTHASVDVPGAGKQTPLDLILHTFLAEHAELTQKQTGADFFAHRRKCLTPFMELLQDYYPHSRDLTKIFHTMGILGWIEETRV